MKKYYSILLLLVLSTGTFSAYAQEGGVLISRNSGSFFIAITAGILLAFAFQFIITNLAVALGITAIGDVRKSGNSDSDSSSSSSDSTPTGVKISTGAGVFMLVTLSISLFFASLIAVKLSLIPGNIIGLSLGLVIWAGTLLLGIYLDSKLISTLAGSFFGLVKNTLSTSVSAVESIFGSSTEKKMKNTARETVKTIHDEIRQEYDLSGFQQKMDEYVSKLEPQRFDADTLQEHLLDLLNEIEIREQYTPDDPDATKRMFLDIAEKQKGLSGKDKENLKNAFDKAREAMKTKGSKADKAAAFVDKITPGNEQQGKEYRQKVVQFLRDTNREELNPDNLRDDLDRILNHPAAAPEVVKTRVSQLDRTTLKSAMATNGFSEDQAEKILSTAENVIQNIQTKTSETTGKANKTGQDVKQQSQEMMEERKVKAEMAIRNWFDRMNQPELQYERLKMDVERMMDDPKAAPHILKNRLSKLDRESLIALLSNNKRISRQQAEKAVVKVEEARDNVIRKIDEVENEVKLRLKQARQETLKQVEATRKTAAALAWWVLIAAVVSGGASVLGGILAFTF